MLTNYRKSQGIQYSKENRFYCDSDGCRFEHFCEVYIRMTKYCVDCSSVR